MRIISIEILKPGSFQLLQKLEDLKIIRLISLKPPKALKQKKGSGFFLTAGLWKGRDITAEQLRENAWKRK